MKKRVRDGTAWPLLCTLLVLALISLTVYCGSPHAVEYCDSTSCRLIASTHGAPQAGVEQGRLWLLHDDAIEVFSNGVREASLPASAMPPGFSIEKTDPNGPAHFAVTSSGVWAYSNIDVIHFDGRSIAAFPQVTRNPIRAIAAAGESAWVLDSENAVFTFDGKEWSRSVLESAGDLSCPPLLAYAGGSLWLSRCNELFQVNGSSLTKVLRDGGEVLAGQIKLWEAPGGLWLTSESLSLAHYDVQAGRWTTVPLPKMSSEFFEDARSPTLRAANAAYELNAASLSWKQLPASLQASDWQVRSVLGDGGTHWYRVTTPVDSVVRTTLILLAGSAVFASIVIVRSRSKRPKVENRDPWHQHTGRVAQYLSVNMLAAEIICLGLFFIHTLDGQFRERWILRCKESCTATAASIDRPEKLLTTGSASGKQRLWSVGPYGIALEDSGRVFTLPELGIDGMETITDSDTKENTIWLLTSGWMGSSATSVEYDEKNEALQVRTFPRILNAQDARFQRSPSTGDIVAVSLSGNGHADLRGSMWKRIDGSSAPQTLWGIAGYTGSALLDDRQHWLVTTAQGVQERIGDKWSPVEVQGEKVKGEIFWLRERNEICVIGRYAIWFFDSRKTSWTVVRLSAPFFSTYFELIGPFEQQDGSIDVFSTRGAINISPDGGVRNIPPSPDIHHFRSRIGLPDGGTAALVAITGFGAATAYAPNAALLFLLTAVVVHIFMVVRDVRRTRSKVTAKAHAFELLAKAEPLLGKKLGERSPLRLWWQRLLETHTSPRVAIFLSVGFALASGVAFLFFGFGNFLMEILAVGAFWICFELILIARARMQEQLAEIDDSEAFLEKRRRFLTRRGSVRHTLVQALRLEAEGEDEKAEALIRAKLIELGPKLATNRGLCAFAGSLAFRRGDYERAALFSEAALLFGSRSPAARCNFAESLLRTSGRFEDAYFWSELTTRTSHDVRPVILQAWAANSLGCETFARTTLRRVIKRFKRSLSSNNEKERGLALALLDLLFKALERTGDHLSRNELEALARRGYELPGPVEASRTLQEQQRSA